MVIVEVYVSNGATPGTVQLQWAQLVSDGTATTVRAGSHMRADQVA